MAKGKEAAQGRTWQEEKGKGKEAKTLLETKGPKADPCKEAVSKEKESELVKPQAVASEKKATSGKAADPLVT